MKRADSSPVELERVAQTFRTWWTEAEHVLVGAGAGLSAAAGIDYTDVADFARVFPVLARRGFKARYQLIGFEGFRPAQHWAYWATHVDNVRFGPRPHPIYAQLRELVAGKDVFVLTSNVDAMFMRNGFDAERVFTPQGDYAAMQCRKPCRASVWPSQPAIERVLAHVDFEAFEVIEPTAIPRCPTCGGEVFLNVRVDRAFVDAPYRQQANLFRSWLATATRGRLLLLEVGAGFNTPTVVRWQMERLAVALPQARFVRVNRDDAEVGEVPRERALTVPADAGDAIEAFAASCLRADAARRAAQ